MSPEKAKTYPLACDGSERFKRSSVCTSSPLRSLRPPRGMARLGAPGWAGENSGHFEHPAWRVGVVAILDAYGGHRSQNEFFRSLLDSSRLHQEPDHDYQVPDRPESICPESKVLCMVWSTPVGRIADAGCPVNREGLVGERFRSTETYLRSLTRARGFDAIGSVSHSRFRWGSLNIVPHSRQRTFPVGLPLLVRTSSMRRW